MQAVFTGFGVPIRGVFPPGYLLGSRTKITATGTSTYTTPQGCRLLLVECIGGGGGGGSAGNAPAGQIQAGAGGVSGSYSATSIPTASGKTFTAVVNAGGAGNNNGGVTTFTGTGGMVWCSAQGGSAGGVTGFGSTEVYANNGVNAQGVSVGDIATGVNASGVAHRVSGTVAISGRGANGPFGGGALPIKAQGNGVAGGNYGAGGSGSMSVNAGGAATGGHGAQGVILVSEFY